jgi:hypothetical protein
MKSKLTNLAVPALMCGLCFPAFAEDRTDSPASRVPAKVKQGVSATVGSSSPAKRAADAGRVDPSRQPAEVSEAPAPVAPKPAALQLFRENVTQEEMMRFD